MPCKSLYNTCQVVPLASQLNEIWLPPQFNREREYEKTENSVLIAYLISTKEYSSI